MYILPDGNEIEIELEIKIGNEISIYFCLL